MCYGAGRRKRLLHYIVNRVLFFVLLQLRRKPRRRDAACVKVTEGTIGVGGGKHKKSCPRLRMGGGV